MTEASTLEILEARAARLASPVAESVDESASALVVHVGSETYAIPIQYLAEILTGIVCTKIPGADVGIFGVAAYRGRVIPVLDLAVLLGTRSEEPVSVRPILVLSARKRTVGLSVDSVGGIVAIQEAAEGIEFTQFSRKPNADGPWIIQMELLFAHPLVKRVLAPL